MAVLEYIFHGSCRKTSKVLSTAFEPISKSTAHELANNEIKLAEERKERLIIAVEEIKLKLTLSTAKAGRFLLLGCSSVRCSSPF